MQRDVAEPQLLVSSWALASARERVEVRRWCQPAAAGRSRGVAAQRGRAAPPGRWSTWCGCGRSGTCRRATPTRNTASHSRPLARCTVSSLTESASVGVATSRPVPVLVLGLQVGQQRRQRDRAVDGLELRDRLDEQVEVVAPGLRRRAHRRRQLDVDAGGVDDPPDQVEQRLAGVRRAASRSSAASRPNRSPRLVGVVARPPGPRARRCSETTSVGSAPATAAVELVARASAAGRGRRGSSTGAASRARRPSSARSRGPIAQRGPVEQGEQRGVGGQVVQQGQRGHHLGHLRAAAAAPGGRRSRPGSRPRSARRRRRRRARCRGSARRSRATTGSAIARVRADDLVGAARPARRRTSRARRPGPRPAPPCGLGSSSAAPTANCA